ncbi:T9SS type A sorting domain-containing protein [Dyadobacter sp. 32]|uniref:T9SS type A sorting domain-containing protein n=1 Tax=Dyadobacter sp. 32 TaxID=538966 RepID=UPI0011ECDC6C
MHYNFQLRFLIICILTFYSAVYTYAQRVCPASMEICINRSPFVLSGATISGGTYSRTGVSAGVFDPAVAGEGNHLITYNYLDVNNQESSCSFNISVYTVVPTSCALVVQSYCTGMGPVMVPNLCNIQPNMTVGDYSGTGFTDNLFNPAAAGVGLHDYSFTVTDDNGCIGYGSGTIQVSDAVPPTLTCPPNRTVNGSSEPAFLLTGGSTSANVSVYSGPGVNGSAGAFTFDPSVAGNGIHQITYTVTNNEELPLYVCESSCTFTIAVGVLPVTINRLNASYKEGNIVVEWETSEESRFDRFELERSLNPKKGFVKIHQISGSNIGNAYSFVDTRSEKGLPIYYRLKMIDLDGSFAYSKITWALVEVSGQFSLYPNPASHEINIQSSSETIETKLFNTAGIEIFSQKYTPTKTKHITLPDVRKGIYLLKVEEATGNSVFSKLIIN